MNMALSGKFFHPRVNNVVAATQWSITGHPDTRPPQGVGAGLVLVCCGLDFPYGVLMALRRSEKGRFGEYTCLTSCSVFPLDVCKNVRLHPVQRHPASHGDVRSMPRLITSNCFFRRRGQVLRKSSKFWCFFLDTASHGFFAPLFCRSYETKPTEDHRERPTLVCGSYLARRKRSEELQEALKERGLHGCHLSGRLCQWKSSLVCS